MKSVFQIIVSIVVGSLLGISVYNKLYFKNTAIQATDIDLDLAFLTDQTDFAQKQKQADSLAYVNYQDSLQRAILFVEKENSKQNKKTGLNSSVTAEMPEKKAVPATAKTRVAVQPKIELPALKKKQVTAPVITDVHIPEKAETTAATKSVAATESTVAVSNATAHVQPQPEKKKKFVLFNKKTNSH